jgi:hypothetical protein
MSEYAGLSTKKEKVVNLAPDASTGALFTIEDAPAAIEEVVQDIPDDDPVDAIARERAAYQQVLRGEGRTEERIRYLTGRRFGPRIARLAIQHDITRLLPTESVAEPEEQPRYRDARSAAANDRLDDD